jgi:hypothetical protein
MYGHCCKFPGCETVISKVNGGQFCFLHARILYQNDVSFQQGRFFIKEQVWNAEKQKEELSKRVLCLFEIKALKETASIEDYLTTDRL